MVKLLSEHGADVNLCFKTPDEFSMWTPLHWGAWEGSYEIVRILLLDTAILFVLELEP